MQDSRTILLVQRLNDLSSQLSDLEDLRLRVEEAERRIGAVPTQPSTVSREATSYVRPLAAVSGPTICGIARSRRRKS